MLLSSLAMLAMSQTFNLVPSDDIWVYPHAGDPSTDAYLRVWGYEGKAVPASGEAESFGISYLKWKLAGLPTGLKLKEATLTLVQTASPGYTLDQATKAPIEARRISPAFDEKSWKYEMVDKLLPLASDETVYGTGAPASLSGETITITIDLLKGKGDFATALKDAGTTKEIAIALTTKLDMAELGRAGIYKLYSKDDRDEKLRPKLTLVFE